jgi:hypothetical protein
MVVIVPKVEGYSQRSAIKFFEAHQTEDAFFETFKYKSYAQFFYGRVEPAHNTPETAKVHYVVCKIQHKDQLLEERPKAVPLYEKGGFSFYRVE